MFEAYTKYEQKELCVSVLEIFSCVSETFSLVGPFTYTHLRIKHHLRTLRSYSEPLCQVILMAQHKQVHYGLGERWGLS